MENDKKPTPEIIVEAIPETGEISAGVDIDGDGKVDIGGSTIITDKRFWSIVSLAIAIGVITKGLGIW